MYPYTLHLYIYVSIYITDFACGSLFHNNNNLFPYNNNQSLFPYNNNQYTTSVRATHQRKIRNIGGELELTLVSPERVIFNFSDRILSAREQFLLSFGLNFNLPIFKPSFYRYFLPYERFMKILERCQLAPGTRFDILKQQIKHVAMKSFCSFKSNRVFSPIFNIQYF